MHRRDIGRRHSLGTPGCVSRALAAVVTVAMVALTPLDGVKGQGVPGDVDCNGVVDGGDLRALETALFMREHNCATADVNGDGDVTAADLVGLIPLLAEQVPATA